MTDDLVRCPECDGTLGTDQTLSGSRTVRFDQTCIDCGTNFVTVCDLVNFSRQTLDD